MIPAAVEARIQRDYNTRIMTPVVRAATDRYRRSGWFVTVNDEDSGMFYYMRRDGKVQASGSGYRVPASQVVYVEVL